MPVKERVENWMNEVLKEMRRTNRFITKKAIFHYGKDRELGRLVGTLQSSHPAKGVIFYARFFLSLSLYPCLSTAVFISRPDWIMLYQGMVCLAANQVWWTAEVEEVFAKVRHGNKRAMKEYLQEQNRQLDELVLKGKAVIWAARPCRQLFNINLGSGKLQGKMCACVFGLLIETFRFWQCALI